MPQIKSVPIRSARPSRGAAQTSQAINSALLATTKKYRTGFRIDTCTDWRGFSKKNAVKK